MSKKVPSPEFSASLTEFATAAERLRQALRTAIAAVLDGPATTRPLADRLGIDKTLAWKCVRLASVPDPASVLADLPGARGWPKVLGGFREAGCPDGLITEVDAAMREIRERLSTRGIDRGTVLAMAGGLMDDERRRSRMLRFRRDHFRASSAIFGISMKARIGAVLFAPSQADPDGASADLAAVSILEGLDRSRPGMPCEVFAPFIPTRRAGADRPPTVAAIDPASELPPLLERFSSPHSIGVEVRPSESGDPGVFEFLQRRPDRTGPLRIASGEFARDFAPRWADPDDDLIEMGMPTGNPTEWQVMTVLLHRELEIASDVQVALYATLVQRRDRNRWAERLRLPLEARVTEMREPSLPSALRKLDRVHRELVDCGAASIGRAASEFRCFQTVVHYPPVPSSIVMRWRRPNRADLPAGEHPRATSRS